MPLSEIKMPNRAVSAHKGGPRTPIGHRSLSMRVTGLNDGFEKIRKETKDVETYKTNNMWRGSEEKSQTK